MESIEIQEAEAHEEGSGEECAKDRALQREFSGEEGGEIADATSACEAETYALASPEAVGSASAECEGAHVGSLVLRTWYMMGEGVKGKTNLIWNQI